MALNQKNKEGESQVIHTHTIYIYIYINGERKKERKRELYIADDYASRRVFFPIAFFRCFHLPLDDAQTQKEREKELDYS